jgi:transcriptional regulator with XRE-family HTH domain
MTPISSGPVRQDGERIRALRIEAGFEMATFARQIGRHPKALQHIEHETRGASPVTLSRIAKALGIDPAEITRVQQGAAA